LNRRTEFRVVTDIPDRRIIFNSAKPGSMDEQQKNLIQDENANPDAEPDTEGDLGNPGSRVNKQ